MSLAAALWTLSFSCLSPPEYAQSSLVQSWGSYRLHFVERDGRVVDPRGGDVTTSEGQAYGMLRAVWMNDRAQFQRIRAWTLRHLQSHREDALPAWKWGEEDGVRGVLDPQPASDADLLIAYALLLAERQWDLRGARAQAQGLLAAIWAEEVTRAGDRWVLLPGPWAGELSPLRINPSYFLPFALRSFAELDPEHPWAELLDDSYALLQESLLPSGLPPDWAYVDPTSGRVVPYPSGSEEQAVFGFESFRVIWNLAADLRWFAEPRAEELLLRWEFLGERWEREGEIPAILGPEGEGRADYVYHGMYGALLPAWSLWNPDRSQRLIETELMPIFREGIWGSKEDYYAQNWIWFGMALDSGLARPLESM